MPKGPFGRCCALEQRRMLGVMKIPMALVLLSLFPMLAGALRLFGLAGLAEVERHSRFAADPVPVVLHIVGATLFTTLGALQFTPRLRRYRWHRLAGRVLAPLGIVAAASGIHMTLSWPPNPLDSPALTVLRVLVGGSMIAFIVASLTFVSRRDFDAHGRWMTRAYALGAGAGTQVFTLGPFALANVFQTKTATVLLMGAGWAINIVVAEWALRRKRAVVGSDAPKQSAADREALDGVASIVR
jgi:hypothetical protein